MAVALCGCARSAPLRSAGPRDGGPWDAIETSLADGPGANPSDTAAVVADGKQAADSVDTSDTGPAVDASAPLPGDAPVTVDAPECTQYPQEPTVDSTGTTQWMWYFSWQESDLANICASYGVGARMVVELSLPMYSFIGSGPACSGGEILNGGSRACAVQGAFRFETPCTSGAAQFAVPGDTMDVGYYHIESQEIPGAPRRLLGQDADCPRALYPSRGLGFVPSAPDSSVPSCPMYPSTSRVDSTGNMVWWWHFGWQQSDLASVCASYGPDAKMVLELGGEKDPPATSLPECTNSEVMGGGAHACTILGRWRVEADCTAGDLLFELPIQAGSGYYHVESAQVPDAARRFVVSDATCPRDLRPSTGPVLGAEALAAGVPISNYPESNYSIGRLDEPAANGQPCHTNGDCPRPDDQRCFIDAAISDCESAPAGRCVYHRTSNCIIWPGCVCLSFYGTICGSYPGTNCGYLSSATSGCAACL